jgi:glycosyltransferase involved in cell wall biosynthesis
MRILHIIDHIGIGGAQKVAEGIVENYRDKKNKSYCYALRKKGEQQSNNENMFTRNTTFKYDLFSLFELKSLIVKNNIEILHCHLFKACFIGYLLKKFYFKKIKLIFHEHGRIFQNSRIYNFFLKHTQNKVDLFIAVSAATKKRLMENARIPEEKIRVLYNFVDLEKFNPEVLKKYDKKGQREKIGIRGDDFVIGFAGRLSKVKGSEYLIKSIHYIINIPNFKVLIAGDGIERIKLEKIAEKLNIKEKIIFWGYVKDILKFYEIIDVLVVPSKFESFGISTIEAQACGIPVIASNVGALNEVIKNDENGLLFEFANEKELAEKIELIEKDKELRERLVKNGVFSVKKYSLEKYLNKLNLIYSDKNE